MNLIALLNVKMVPLASLLTHVSATLAIRGNYATQVCQTHYEKRENEHIIILKFTENQVMCCKKYQQDHRVSNIMKYQNE